MVALLEAFELTGDEMAFPRYPGAFDASTYERGKGNNCRFFFNLMKFCFRELFYTRLKIHIPAALADFP